MDQPSSSRLKKNNIEYSLSLISSLTSFLLWPLLSPSSRSALTHWEEQGIVEGEQVGSWLPLSPDSVSGNSTPLNVSLPDYAISDILVHHIVCCSFQILERCSVFLSSLCRSLKVFVGLWYPLLRIKMLAMPEDGLHSASSTSSAMTQLYVF